MSTQTRRKRLKGGLLIFMIGIMLVTKMHAVSTVDQTTTIKAFETHHVQHAEKEGNFWVNISVVLLCSLTAGLMSGLTIGLASIDRLSLEVDSIGDNEVKIMTDRIFPVIDRHHWMLVTLLVCNASAFETLPIFLDKMVSHVEAIILSVTLVLIFGEVVPMAICTGSKQLQIAYYLCPLVYVLMWLTSPVSWPIATCLDYLLGEHKF